MRNKKYILLGIFANCIWGLAFLVPYVLSSVSPIVISFGRYVVYGLISMVLATLNLGQFKDMQVSDWITAFIYAFAGNIGYYFFLTTSIGYGGVTIAALVVGTLPIVMMLAGNWSETKLPWRKLILPFILIAAGIGALNLVDDRNQLQFNNIDRLYSFFYATVALILWTYYGVSNALYLKKNKKLSSETWSLAIGIACLVQCVVAMPLVAFFLGDPFVDIRGEMITYTVLGCVFLGVIVSWYATIVWNYTSRNIPVAIAGQLIVFETISSIVYGYVFDSKFPPVNEIVAIFLILIGVTVGIRVFNREVG